MPQFTKYALENSLKKLLLQKPLNKITINDITEDCGINRMTFYYHFRDIYDLVEWVCLEDAKKALADNKTYETWQQGFVRIFDAVRENKPFIMNVYRCVSREQVEKYLTPLTDDLLMGVINELSAEMVVRAEDKAFIAQVYSYAFVGLMLDVIQEESASMVIREEDKQFIAKIYAYIFIGVMLDWIKDDMREAPQEIVARLVKLLRGSVTAALRRFRL